MEYPRSVQIVEVGPRDGLQNEPSRISTRDKVQFIGRLADAGLRHIEAGSFVSETSVPAMAGSADVFKAIRKKPEVVYSALVPNLKGLEAALAAGVDEVAVFASASETFSQRNIRCSIDESLTRYREVCGAALASDISVRGYVSCVAGCPYEGRVAHDAVLRVAESLRAIGCYEISLGDTIGVGTAGSISALLEHILKSLEVQCLAVHFHDTYGQALANILIALQTGITVIDSAAAGLGGCPYAPGATGNVATEDVLYLLNGLNIETGADLDRVAQAGSEICALLGRTSASRVSQALQALASKR